MQCPQVYWPLGSPWAAPALCDGSFCSARSLLSLPPPSKGSSVSAGMGGELGPHKLTALMNLHSSQFALAKVWFGCDAQDAVVPCSRQPVVLLAPWEAMGTSEVMNP